MIKSLDVIVQGMIDTGYTPEDANTYAHDIPVNFVPVEIDAIARVILSDSQKLANLLEAISDGFDIELPATLEEVAFERFAYYLTHNPDLGMDFSV